MSTKRTGPSTPAPQEIPASNASPKYKAPIGGPPAGLHCASGGPNTSAEDQATLASIGGVSSALHQTRATSVDGPKAHLEIKVNVNTVSEWVGSSYDYATITITPELAANIRRYHQALGELDVDQIHKADDTLDMHILESSEVDDPKLVVSYSNGNSGDEFWWEGGYRQFDTTWKTQPISLSVLDSEPGSSLDLRTEMEDPEIDEAAED